MATPAKDKYADLWDRLSTDDRQLLDTTTQNWTKKIQDTRTLGSNALKDQKKDHDKEVQKWKEDFQSLEKTVSQLKFDEDKMTDEVTALRKDKQDLQQKLAAAPQSVSQAGPSHTKKITVKQPEMYKTSKSIKNYVKLWDNYARIMNMTGTQTIQSFYTFVDEEVQEKLGELSDNEQKTWKDFKDLVLKTLEKPASKTAMRHKLRALKQGRDESVLEYKEKLEKIANQAYAEGQNKEKDDALKDALASGLRNDEVAIKIIGKETWSFKDSVDYAMSRENSVTARKEMSHNGSSVEVAILKVDDATPNNDICMISGAEPFPQRPELRSNNFKKCYNCNKPGHLAATCTSKAVCYFCDQPGHIKNACFKYLNQKRSTAGGSGVKNAGQNGGGSYQRWQGQNQRMSQDDHTLPRRRLNFPQQRAPYSPHRPAYPQPGNSGFRVHPSRMNNNQQQGNFSNRAQNPGACNRPMRQNFRGRNATAPAAKN